MKKSSYTTIGWFIKIAIVLLAFWYIYKRLFLSQDFEDLSTGMQELVDGSDYSILIIVLLLMFANWGIEAAKWRFLIGKVERISFRKSLKAIFSGVTVSVFTPNKIGEYGGRVFHLAKADRIEAILITLIGSMSQLLVTLVTGILALIYFYAVYFVSEDHSDQYFFYALTITSFLLILLLLIIFFNASLLKPLFERIKLLGRFRKYGRAFAFYSSGELLKVILFGLARFFVFSTQLYLLLRAFNVPVPYWEGMIVIALIFFMITIIPRPIAFAELGVRGSTALYFLSYFSDNELGILTSILLLWVINLALPAVIGSLFIFSLKFFRKKR